MTTKKQDIKNWIQKGMEQHSTHVVIAVDTWDYEDYPIYISVEENVHDTINSYKDKQDRIMEVYNLSIDIDSQLNEYRTWNL